MSEFWEVIDEHWSDIWEALRATLPVKEHRMFDDDGELIECNRPMEESIIADKIGRKERLAYYLYAANLFDSGIKEQVIDGKRVIEVGAGSPLRMGFSGKGDKA